MNELFNKISIWHMTIVYIVANLLNFGFVIPLKQFVLVSQDVVDVLMQGTMFLIIAFWFIVLILKNKISVLSEIKAIKSKINLKEFSVILIFNYAASLSFVFAILIAVSIFWGQGTESTMMSVGAEQDNNSLYTLLQFMATVVLAPIVEEFMFRGVLLSRLKRKLPITVAIIISSVFFGVTHLSIATLGATIFGICMCVLYIKTNNIFVPISMHILHNFILSAVQILPTKSISNIELTTTVVLIGFIICLIMTIWACIYLVYKFKFFHFRKYQINQ